MSKKRGKKSKAKANRPAIPPLSPPVYRRYYLALEEGENTAWNNQNIFWDIGPGERPYVVQAHLRKVARECEIPVTIEIASKSKNPSLKLTYHSRPEPQAIRIIGKDGCLKAIAIDERE